MPAELSVGVVLPTKNEPRWIQDETRFNDAFKAAGYDVQILFSDGDSAKEKANVEVADQPGRESDHHLPAGRDRRRGRCSGSEGCGREGDVVRPADPGHGCGRLLCDV